MSEPNKTVPRTEVVLKKALVQAGEDCPVGSKIEVTPQQRIALEESGHIEAKKGES